jgi:hypothetical protein
LTAPPTQTAPKARNKMRCIDSILSTQFTALRKLSGRRSWAVTEN